MRKIDYLFDSTVVKIRIKLLQSDQIAQQKLNVCSCGNVIEYSNFSIGRENAKSFVFFPVLLSGLLQIDYILVISAFSFIFHIDI